MLALAQAAADEETLGTVRARLAAQGSGTATTAGGAASEEDLMRQGLEAFYTRRDAAAAIAAFRAVLQHNPDHYGANYQLAVALNAAGQKDDARLQWEKVLKLAEIYKDQPTIDTAKLRLAAQ